jgi:hypothetical protein
VDVSDEDMERQAAEKRLNFMQTLGAGAGAAASTVMDATGRIGSRTVDALADRTAKALAARAPAGALPTAAPPGVAPSGGALTPEPSAQSTRIMQGGQGDPLGTTGRARQEGYNTETARRAAVANEIKATNPQARQILANAPGMTSTPSGVLYPTTEMRPTLGPRGQRTPQMAPDIGGVRPGGPNMGPSSFTPTAPQGALPAQKPSLARQAINMGRKAMDIPVLGPATTGALGGFGAVTEASDAAERYKRGDMLGAGISGLGALGAATAVIPHPVTRVVGGGLAMAAPMANMIVDYMRQSSPLSQAQQNPAGR